jgi:hypothetical protein
LAIVMGVLLPSQVTAEVAVRLVADDQPHIEVSGIPADAMAALAGDRADQSALASLLTVHVVEGTRPSVAPVIGDYSVDRGRLIFVPRFPLKPGLQYRVVFDPAGLPRDSARLTNRVEAVVSLPAPPREKATNVSAIYPSADVLPENQLKFYIQFSAPMSRGDSYRHIRLLDGNGTHVEAPYLELGEELWDQSGTRLTLLLDPGRVKHDLKPHVEVGAVLVQGRAYTLHVMNTWRDAQGVLLGNEPRKKFRVTSPDVRQPDPRRWKLTLPAAGTRKPLVVELDEPLDHALLQHAIQVAPSGSPNINGEVSIDQRETRWTFTPATPWNEGDYQLVIDSTLEDLAGNSIERPFEVRSQRDKSARSGRTTIEFAVKRN